MSPAEVAAFLGVSTGVVQHLELSGRLVGTRERTAQGALRVYYDRDAVEALDYKPKRKRRRYTTLKIRTKAKASAKCFQLFAEGKTYQEVVIETKLDPERVLELWETYSMTPQQLAQHRKLQEDERAFDVERRRESWRDFKLKMKKLDPKGLSREELMLAIEGVVTKVLETKGEKPPSDEPARSVPPQPKS